MNPVEPNVENLAPGWERVCYAEHQPEYIPLPSLQELKPSHAQSTIAIPMRVVSVWEPDDAEVMQLVEMIRAWDNGGPKPRISLMSHVHGQALQPIRLVVGGFSEPYVQAVPPEDDVVVRPRTGVDRVPGPPDPPKNSHRPVG